MLTRAQVAKRLGKSIATVRRLEGVALHPVLDRDGVHRFDPEEVERLAGGALRRWAGSSHAAQSDWFRDWRSRTAVGRGFTGDAPDSGEDRELDEGDDEGDWRAREDELAQRERELGLREQALREHEERLRAGELAADRERKEQHVAREPTAAEALRADPSFPHAVQVQVAALIDELARLPPRIARKVLSDEDMVLLEALVNEEFE